MSGQPENCCGRHQQQWRPKNVSELSERVLDNIYDGNNSLKHFLRGRRAVSQKTTSERGTSPIRSCPSHAIIPRLRVFIILCQL